MRYFYVCGSTFTGHWKKGGRGVHFVLSNRGGRRYEGWPAEYVLAA